VKNNRLQPERAADREYVVCIRRTVDDDTRNAQPRRAFLVGKIAGIEPVQDDNGRQRYFIKISEYAEIDEVIDERWRNPVRYTDLLKLGINERALKFKPLRQSRTEASRQTTGGNSGMNIAAAKKALSEHYKVPETAIKITIEM
jgi:hypothetical protein